MIGLFFNFVCAVRRRCEPLVRRGYREGERGGRGEGETGSEASRAVTRISRVVAGTSQLSSLNSHLDWVRRFASALSVVVLLILLISPLRAADPVTLENTRAIAAQRFGGPLYLTGELHYHQSGILECRLRFEIVSGGSVITVVESDPRVLTAGTTRFRQILPVLPAEVYPGMNAAVHVRLKSETYDFPLESIPVNLASADEAPYVLLQVRSKLDSGAALGKARDSLSILNAAHVLGTRTFFSPALMADELPEQSLAYCAVDGVVVTSRGFAEMTRRQMDALAEWTRAGGSVCINLAESIALEPKHADFLNELFRDANRSPWVLNEKSRIESADLTDAFFIDQTGLGVTIIVQEPPDWESTAWRRAFGEFWHLRNDFAELIATTDPNSEPAAALRLRQNALSQRALSINYANLAASSVFYETPAIGRKVFEELRPDHVRLLPGWAVMGVLFFYVLIVGPIDYWLLGWLKMRRWTWVVFPLVTVLITVGLVAMANAFMGTAMRPRSVTIIDCDADGEPVRINTLDFLFENSSRAFTYQHDAKTFSPLGPAYFHASPFQPPGMVLTNGNPWQNATIDNDAATGPYRGTFPSRYIVTQRVGKWTPQVNRTLAIGPEIEIPQIDWEAASKPNAYSLELPDGRTARVFHITGEAADRDLGIKLPPGTNVSQGYAMQIQVARRAERIKKARRENYQKLSRLITLRAPGASGRSPLGLGRLDDLPLVDPLDPNSRAVVIKVVEPDGNITIYRKPVRKK